MRKRRPKPQEAPIKVVRVKRLKLAELMKERKVSAYALSKAIKVSINTIRSYKRDEGRDPDHSMIVNLKTYFGLENDEDLVEYEEVTD